MGDRVATLKYLDPTLPPEEFPLQNHMRERNIIDGRTIPELCPDSGARIVDTLDASGFGLFGVPPSCDVGVSLDTLRDPDLVKERYMPQLMEWLQQQTGAAHVFGVNGVHRRSLAGRADAAMRDAMSRNHFVVPGAWTGAISHRR